LPIIDSTEDLDKFLMGPITKELRNIIGGSNGLSEQIKWQIQHALLETVYDQPEPDPDIYQRSYQVLNAITISKIYVSNGIIVSNIYMDPRKLEAIQTGLFYNSHMSLDGQSFKKPLLERLDSGLQYQNESPYWNPPAQGYQYLDTAYKNIVNDNIIFKAIKNGFAKYNIRVEIKEIYGI
jgi:hypothetical protein